MVLCMGCGDAEQAASVDAGPVTPPGDSLVTESGDGAEEVVTVPEPPSTVWLTAPALCAAAGEIPPDPLVRAASEQPEVPPKSNGKPGTVHLVDLVVDEADGLIYATGLPSLAIMASAGGALTTLGTLKGKAEHIALIGPGRVALTSRGHSSKNAGGSAQGGGGGGGGGNKGAPGVSIVDVSNPAAPTKLGLVELEDAAGLAASGAFLYVLTHAGALHTFDLAAGAMPVHVHEMTGLGTPWNLAIAGGRAYIADNSQGLVVVDLATPEAPQVVTSVMAAGGAQDVAIDGDTLFLAVGSRGVEAFDISSPDAPVSRSLTETGVAVINVSASGGLVWYTTQQSVGVLDATDPSALRSLAVEDTPSWAMAVTAVGTTAYVADWKTVDIFEVEPTVLAADADPERDEYIFVGSTQEMTVELANRGGAPLIVSGVSVDDPRLEVLVDTLEIAPGDTGRLRLVFTNDGEPLEATLCLSSNDPDEPVQTFPVSSTSSDPNAMVGLEAPDFTLPDLEGESHALSQQLGNPVVLCYFATW